MAGAAVHRAGANAAGEQADGRGVHLVVLVADVGGLGGCGRWGLVVNADERGMGVDDPLHVGEAPEDLRNLL